MSRFHHPSRNTIFRWRRSFAAHNSAMERVRSDTPHPAPRRNSIPCAEPRVRHTLKSLSADTSGAVVSVSSATAFIGLLVPHERSVWPAGGDQIVVNSALSDSPALKYDDFASVSNRAQAVCDHKASATALPQVADDLGFGLRIQRTGRLVQIQQCRVTRKGSRNLQTLQLTAAPVDAAFSNSGVQPPNERRSRRLCRRHESRPGRRSSGTPRLLEIRLSRTVPSKTMMS